MNSQELIEQHRDTLLRLEKERGIRVLFAAAVGSRAYGLNHVDSDCDAHFVYVYPKEAYLNLSQPAEFLKPKDDLNGWELRKFLMMLRKSAFNVIEFLNSPLVIMGDSSELLDLAYKCKSATKLVSSLCGCVFREENKVNKDSDGYTNAKAVVSAARLVLTASLVHHHKEQQSYYPPIIFDEILEKCRKECIISEDELNNLEMFVEMKRTYTGCQKEFAQEMMSNLMERTRSLMEAMKDFDDLVPPDDVYDILNSFFRKELQP